MGLAVGPIDDELGEGVGALAVNCAQGLAAMLASEVGVELLATFAGRVDCGGAVSTLVEQLDGTASSTARRFTGVISSEPRLLGSL